jgi:hypothetical protein
MNRLRSLSTSALSPQPKACSAAGLHHLWAQTINLQVSDARDMWWHCKIGFILSENVWFSWFSPSKYTHAAYLSSSKTEFVYLYHTVSYPYLCWLGKSPDMEQSYYIKSTINDILHARSISNQYVAIRVAPYLLSSNLGTICVDDPGMSYG